MWHSVIYPYPQLRYANEYFNEKQEPFHRREILETIGRQSIENVISKPDGKFFVASKITEILSPYAQ